MQFCPASSINWRMRRTNKNQLYSKYTYINYIQKAVPSPTGFVTFENAEARSLHLIRTVPANYNTCRLDRFQKHSIPTRTTFKPVYISSSHNCTICKLFLRSWAQMAGQVGEDTILCLRDALRSPPHNLRPLCQPFPRQAAVGRSKNFANRENVLQDLRRSRRFIARQQQGEASMNNGKVNIALHI